MGSKPSVTQPIVEPVIPKKPEPTPMDAVKALQGEIDSLNKRIDYQTIRSKNQQQLAQSALCKGDRESAKRYLQKKTQYDTSVKQLYNMVSMIESQLLAIESLTTNTQVMKSTVVATNVLKSKTISQDDAETVMEECREQMDNVTQLTSILSEPLVHLPDVDEELRELEASIQLPVAPRRIPTSPKRVEVSKLEAIAE